LLPADETRVNDGGVNVRLLNDVAYKFGSAGACYALEAEWRLPGTGAVAAGPRGMIAIKSSDVEDDGAHGDER